MVRIGLSQMFARGTQNAWDDGAGGHGPVVTYRIETIEGDSGSYWNRYTSSI